MANTLTDKDAQSRPYVMVRDREGDLWKFRKLIAVLPHFSTGNDVFYTVGLDGAFSTWQSCTRASLDQIKKALTPDNCRTPSEADASFTRPVAVWDDTELKWVPRILVAVFPDEETGYVTLSRCRSYCEQWQECRFFTSDELKSLK